MSTIREWDTEVVPMREHYLDHPGKLLIKVDDGRGNLQTQTLDGFKIPLGLIDDIITKGGANHIYLAFATPKLQVGNATNQREVTTIVCGSNASDEILTGLMYDFLDPCPTSCPKNKLKIRLLGFAGEFVSLNKRPAGTGYTKLSVQEAKDMQSAYTTTDIDRVIRFPNVNPKRICGFWLDKPIIDDLLSIPKQYVSHFFLYFGCTYGSIFENDYDRKFFTLMACAVDIKNSIFTNFVFDEMEKTYLGSTRYPKGIFTCLA